MQDLGLVTAYAYAVSGGYTGTKEEFAELMASYATVAEEAADSAEAAEASATQAAASATQAGQSATNAASSASAAGTSASNAQTAANSAAQSKADAAGSTTAAANSASQAAGSASGAAASAAAASGSATAAEASKTAAQTAQTAAETARTGAETAQGAAEDAQTAAETAAASVTASAAQIAQNAEDIADLQTAMETKAEIDGTYEDMTVGNAKQLVSTVGVDDAAPYLFRKTGGTADVGDRMELRKVVGGTVAWNQLVDTNTTSVTVQSGHKYYSKIGGTVSISASTGTAISVTGGTDNVIDLTTAFGTTIADYIYSLEIATAGAGVAWLKAHGFMTKDYYPYCEPTLMHVQTSGHKTVGFNQLDEDVAMPDIGFTKQSDGSWYAAMASLSLNKTLWENKTGYSGQICITWTYRFSDASAQGVRFVFKYTDGTDGYITYSSTTSYVTMSKKSAAGKIVDTIKCSYGTGTISTWYKDININYSLDGERDGEYEPYSEHSYPLDDSLTLRGIPKLDGNNELYYDGDEYTADGNVSRRYGIVDLGTLSWVYVTTSDRNYFRVNTTIARKTNSPVICSKYAYGGNVYDSAMADAQTGIYTATDSKLVQIKDTNYTDATAFKASLSGVYMVYELDTPTTETAEPYREAQICDPYGTEQYIDTRDIPVPVGHVAFYPDNLRKKIEDLPWNFATLIAPTEKTYTATRNYTTGSLFIIKNILYKATANIANGGTITPGTNCTATTLAEIIAAMA